MEFLIVLSLCVQLKSLVAKVPVRKLEPFCIKTCFLLTVEEKGKDPVLMSPFGGQQIYMGYWESTFWLGCELWCLYYCLVYFCFRLYRFHFLSSCDLPVTCIKWIISGLFDLMMWAFHITEFEQHTFIIFHSDVLNTDLEAKGWMK